MGALHEGHRALLRRASEVADSTVVSIFVNPLQFAPTEDLDRYPRTFEADLAMCADEGVALVFAPDRAQMYPREPLVRIDGRSDRRPLRRSQPTRTLRRRLDRRGQTVRVGAPRCRGLRRQRCAATRPRSAHGRRSRSACAHRSRPDRQGRRRAGLVESQRVSVGTATTRRAGVVARDSRRRRWRSADGASPAEIVDAARAVLGDADGVTPDYVDLVDPDSFEPIEAADDRPRRNRSGAGAGRPRGLDPADRQYGDDACSRPPRRRTVRRAR